jgi:phage regulator Rha-like protein
MSNLNVTTQNNTLVVDSRLIAEDLGIEHRALVQTIKKHQSVIEQHFGVVTFEMSKPLEGSQGGRPENIAYLTEDQATLLMSFSRNTEQVINCKVNLVKAFSLAKNNYAQTPPTLPQNYKEALKALVAEVEARERLEAEKTLLESENHQLSEALDELFDYSSIVRIAKFNKVHESNFSWRPLKAMSIEMGLEIKKVPDARYEFKNIYSHDVWRVVYPDVKLPETTTLVINR